MSTVYHYNSKEYLNKFPFPVNNFDQLLIACYSINHFVLEDNKIQYLRRLIIALPGYQISLTSCTKCEQLDVNA